MPNAPHPKTWSSVPMYVYALANGRSGLVKVGKSLDPKTRTNALITQGGVQDPVVYFSDPVHDGSALERMVHTELASFRVVGEWFSCSFQNCVEAIKACYSRAVPFSQATGSEIKEWHEKSVQGLINALYSNPLYSDAVDCCKNSIFLQDAYKSCCASLAIQAEKGGWQHGAASPDRLRSLYAAKDQLLFELGRISTLLDVKIHNLTMCTRASVEEVATQVHDEGRTVPDDFDIDEYDGAVNDWVNLLASNIDKVA